MMGSKEEFNMVESKTELILDPNINWAPEDMDDICLSLIQNPSLIPLSPSMIHMDNEETLDVNDKFTIQHNMIEYKPKMTYGPPERRVFSGDLNFEVEVHSSDVHKRRYLFSNKLNRIYVDMGQNFSMKFVWDFARSPLPMYVRATTVFSDEAQAEKRVDRCLQHKHATNTGTDPILINHVLRSTRDWPTKGVFYCGESQRTDSWFSVLVEFPTSPEAGDLAFKHAYQFVCKNSCSTGINRRSIDIIFTLEDQTGYIYGRQTVGARVCACPRRDMIKDEETEGVYLQGKKRVASNKIEVKAKKIKVEVVEDDNAVITVPAGLQIVGAKTFTTGLSVWLNMMELSLSHKKNDPKAAETLTKSIAAIKALKEQFKP